VTTTPRIQFAPGGQPRLLAGSWRLDPAHSHASFSARVAGRSVRGRLPLTGRVLIAEPVEDSTACLVTRSSAVSTGSPVLNRLLTGPGFLDAGTFPEISFRSELLAWVPAGWRAVGLLRVKDVEHELACVLAAVSDAHGDQVAYNGHLLYTFADDHAGQVTGQGVQGFFVATPGLRPLTGSPTSTGTVPATSSGTGYGY
jgi:hypothetical protein